MPFPDGAEHPWSKFWYKQTMKMLLPQQCNHPKTQTCMCLQKPSKRMRIIYKKKWKWHRCSIRYVQDWLTKSHQPAWMCIFQHACFYTCMQKFKSFLIKYSSKIRHYIFFESEQNKKNPDHYISKRQHQIIYL